MDIVKLFFLVFFGFLMHCSFGQEEEILWSSEHRLSWPDFKGTPPVGDRAAAVTASGITYQFSTLESRNGVEIDFEVIAFYYPNKSWYRPEAASPLILSHEQLHFDISEMYARKMRHILRTTRFTKNVKAEIRTIYKQIIKELSAFQDRYDEETNFSRNREQQLLWNQKIAKALK